MLSDLAGLPVATWPRTIWMSIIAAVFVAIPSDLIDTPIFGRPIEAKAIDYVILAVTALLIGLIFAIRQAPSAEAERQDKNTLWGGFVSFLAVGCPVCNQVVVGLLGVSGALAWWAPVQPLVGLAAVGILLYTLRRRLNSYQLEACPVSV